VKRLQNDSSSPRFLPLHPRQVQSTDCGRNKQGCLNIGNIKRPCSLDQLDVRRGGRTQKEQPTAEGEKSIKHYVVACEKKTGPSEVYPNLEHPQEYDVVEHEQEP